MSVPARAEARAARATSWSGAGRIGSRDDVTRVLAAVTAEGARRDRTASMAQVVDRADDVALTTPDGARTLPVPPELGELLPWPGGLRRGATVAVTGSASLLLTVLAGAMSQGAWAAVVGLPALNAVPAQVEYGIDLARLAFVPDPGPDWATVVAALIDGLDAVVVATPGPVPAGTARALMSRARRRGCVLLPTTAWPGCDLTLQVLERRWHGLGQGRCRLRLQEVVLGASGRGRAERPRRVDTTLPPPSIVEQVGPLPGQIPGLPRERVLHPDRPVATRPALVPAITPAPEPEPEPWWERYRVS